MVNMTEGIWEYAEVLTACDPEGEQDREFRGFLEPVSMTSCSGLGRGPGLKPKERLRLISHPSEDFFEGRSRRLIHGGRAFELMAVKEVFAGGTLSHRECVLLELKEASGSD